jgi:HK97 family phage portal protein
MGLLRDVILGTPSPAPSEGTGDVTAAVQPFRVSPSIQSFFGQFATSRHDAMSVPAVARARNLIAGTISSMPLDMFVQDMATQEINQVPPLPWVRQPQFDTPRMTTLAYTIDSLLFYGRGYWMVTETYAEDGRPKAFRWVDPLDVTFDVDLETGLITRYYFRLSATPQSGVGSLVVFTSIDEGILVRAGQTIRTCVELERAALEFSRNPSPSITLKNTGAELPSDQVQNILDRWRESRRSSGGAVAYLSASMDLDSVGFSPKDLAMVEAREFQVAEIARVTGLPGVLLGASMAGMTYQNVQAERRGLVDLALQPYMSAIEQRLSMDDVTPRGTSLMFQPNDFLRATPIEEAQLLSVLLDRDVITIDEARRRIGEPGGPLS